MVDVKNLASTRGDRLMSISDFTRSMIDALVPAYCPACGAPLVESFAAMCRPCEDTLQPGPQNIEGQIALFSYEGPLRTAITRGKFDPDEIRLRALLPIFRAALRKYASAVASVDGVVFVPSASKRLHKRGFDFAALLAAVSSASLAVPVCDVLRCTRSDAPLSAGSDREARKLAVAGRYRASRPAAGHMLLIDDIRTTGATLTEAESTLRDAGCEQVTKLVFAQTPSSHPSTAYR